MTARSVVKKHKGFRAAKESPKDMEKVLRLLAQGKKAEAGKLLQRRSQQMKKTAKRQVGKLLPAAL